MQNYLFLELVGRRVAFMNSDHVFTFFLYSENGKRGYLLTFVIA